VDTHLLELLSTWPDRQDEFVLFYNRGNPGFERIRPRLDKLSNVRQVPVFSLSGLAMRLRGLPGYGALRVALYLSQPVTFICMVWRLSRLFAKAAAFDVLLADNGGYPGSRGCLGALLAARRTKVPVRILLVHHAATRPGLCMGWFERLVDGMVSDAASAIVCVSRATRQSLLDNRAFDAEEVRLRVVHNGLSAAGIEAPSTLNALNLRSELSMTDELLVAIVGRVEPYKGHEDAIFALARLRPDSSERLRLVVIGSGEEREVARLRRLASRLGVEGNVSFLGYVPGGSIALVSQLDLLLVATRSCAGGLSIESRGMAWACGARSEARHAHW
jgi:glycosyltransferase involved in cell wall biosynthesis